MQLTAVTVLSAPRFTDLMPTTPPSARRSCGGAVRGNELFIYGGFSSGGGLTDLQVYDAGTNTWSLLADPFPVRERHSMDYDPLSDRIVIVGGSTGAAATDTVHLLEGVTRAGTSPGLVPGRPSARLDALLQWVPPLRSFVYFGGRTSLFTASHAADLWTLSVADGGVNWASVVGSGSSPTPRGATCYAWDSDHDLLLVFGGETGNSVYSSETWQWAPDGGGWTNLTPMVTGTPPSARGFCATVWEPRIHRLVLYGGQTNVAPTGGLFSFDPVTRVWTQHTPIGAPGNLSDATAVYSPQLQGIVVFGGRFSGSMYTNQMLLLRMNEPPVVDAGPDLSVGEGSTVLLSGSATDSDGPSPLAYSWSVIQGGASVSFVDAGTLTPTLSVPRVVTPLLVRVKLTADDGLEVATDTVDITVLNSINEPPMASAGTAQTVDAGAVVTLQGVGTDPNNDALTFAWTQVAGPPVTLSAPMSQLTTFTAPVVTTPTNLDFELVVRDLSDPSPPATTRVSVVPITIADAGSDAGVDAGFDAGVDGGSDAGAEDAGLDAGVSPTDAGTDAGSDAGADAGADAGTEARDAGLDAGVPDGGTPPLGPPANLGVACGCSVSDSGAFVLLLLGALSRRRSRSRGR